jgi:hypothetical protein
MEETIFDKIKSFEFDKNEQRIFGIKSGIIWGHSKRNNSIFPMLYISKPKNVSENDFKLLLDSIDIQFKLK